MKTRLLILIFNGVMGIRKKNPHNTKRKQQVEMKHKSAEFNMDKNFKKETEVCFFCKTLGEKYCL